MSAANTLTNAENPGTPASVRHIPGEAGLWVLLFGDMGVFTALFAAYLVSRSRQSELFAASQDHLNRTAGAANTFVLLSSSILIVFAVRAYRSGRLRPMASKLTLAGVGVGACFVVIKTFEYHQKIASGINPSTNDFYMWYFAITGLHLFHVIIGLIVLTIFSRVVRKPEPPSNRIAFFEGVGCFWHLVDLLWLVIFPLIFLVR